METKLHIEDFIPLRDCGKLLTTYMYKLKKLNIDSTRWPSPLYTV